MHLSSEQYANALHELLLEGNPSEVLSNFAGFLRKKGEEKRWKEILLSTIERIEREQKTERLIVTTQFALEKPEKDLLQKKIEELYPGKQCECQYEVDKSVLGVSPKQVSHFRGVFRSGNANSLIHITA